jgi:HAMP domain-containing protein
MPLLHSFRYKRDVLREISRVPFEKWPKDERQEFAKEFRDMVHQIQRATGVTLNE